MALLTNILRWNGLSGTSTLAYNKHFDYFHRLSAVPLSWTNTLVQHQIFELQIRNILKTFYGRNLQNFVISHSVCP
jgi:hypothetical protein